MDDSPAKGIGEVEPSRARRKRVTPPGKERLSARVFSVSTLYLEDVEAIWEFMEECALVHPADEWQVQGKYGLTPSPPVIIETDDTENLSLEDFRKLKRKRISEFQMRTPGVSVSLTLDRWRCVLSGADDHSACVTAFDSINQILDGRKNPILRRITSMTNLISVVLGCMAFGLIVAEIRDSATVSVVSVGLGAVAYLVAAGFWFGFWMKRPYVAVPKYSVDAPSIWEANRANWISQLVFTVLGAVLGALATWLIVGK